MSDHNPHFPSIGSMSNVEDDISDEQYLDSMMTRDKPKPKETNRPLEVLPLREIEEALQVGTYAGERGSPEFLRQAYNDFTVCPIAACRFEHFDRFELARHIEQHDEIQSFRENVLRELRSIETLRERRAQLEDNLQRVKVEVKALDERIRRFDRRGLEDRQKQISELSRILSS